MRNALKFYIDGEWVDPVVPATLDVIDPSTEEPCGTISVGSAADVDRAVKAARRAFGDVLAQHQGAAARPAARHPRRIQEAVRRRGRRAVDGDGSAPREGRHRLQRFRLPQRIAYQHDDISQRTGRIAAHLVG